ncbi:hypothetical protein FHX52_2395 [Humibacillus xanthopallidus]|uniref:Uncharacterized protein n=1 Tax=Humibacillus xanthopallidus TaxID=412689 RepID=A0A543PNN3_9MICO|nr:DUF6308 family protein [Humibacillus xanthopallidus]TQN45695.1 hypothetical protein FHX52_2395 [Humibacillus xanthopallidus]
MAEAGWVQPAPAMLAHAKERALGALELGEATRKMRRFYATTSDYAGASFATIGHNAPDRIGVDDLFATTLLSVDIPAKAARRLTGPGPDADAIRAALAALPDGPLELVDREGLEAMEVLYLHVKKNLAKATAKNSNPWVVASKLCARKRPDLFPVRDKVVCRLLDVQQAGSYRVDWLVFQHLIADPDLRQAVDEVRAGLEADASAEIVLDTEPLRLLDAALWTSVRMG